MRSYKTVLFSACLLTLPACSTLNESLQLGTGLGAVAGAAATYAAESSHGEKPQTNNVLAGAGIGLAVGLITSHLIHQNIQERRYGDGSNQPEMYFGDLPPNPFVFPKNPNKGGR